MGADLGRAHPTDSVPITSLVFPWYPLSTLLVSPGVPLGIVLAACSLRGELISAVALDIARSICTVGSMISAIRADVHAATDHKRALERSARQGSNCLKNHFEPFQ
jgi:hypothetical protein